MRDILLWGLVAFYLLTGLFLVTAPHLFYLSAPGVAETGPYNMHFIRDVGFSFTVSALGIAYGMKSRLKPLVIFGAAWLALHGIFHLILLFGHAEHLSLPTLIDLATVVLPAALITYLAITYEVPINA